MTDHADGAFSVARRFTWEDLDRLVQHYAGQMTPEALAYLASRGIAETTAERFRLGFESAKIGFRAGEAGIAGGYFHNCIVFPITDVHGKVVDLVGRAIDNREPKYRSLLGNSESFFNQPVLAQADDVILVRNVFDVLSLAQERLPAVSMPDQSPLTEQHAELLRGKRVFICYPNDEPGRRESLRTAALLEQRASAVYLVQLPEGLRDVNELFVRLKDPAEVFFRLLNEAVSENLKLPLFPDARSATAFMEEYAKRKRGMANAIATGFPPLDRLLAGGLRTGLYLLTGEMSSGKSTLLRQMADHIAQNGIPVAYVCWEATAYELWCKSIARQLGVPPQDVLSGSVELERVQKAALAYAQAAKHMWTIEGRLDVRLDDVEAMILRVIQSIGKAPVIFVDDLSRVPLHDPNGRLVLNNPATAAVLLHQWSRQWSTPVVAAMPLSQQAEVPMAAEAAVDAILHLEADPSGQTEGNARKVKLCLRKHRNGAVGTVPLTFTKNTALFSTSLSPDEGVY